MVHLAFDVPCSDRFAVSPPIHGNSPYPCSSLTYRTRVFYHAFGRLSTPFAKFDRLFTVFCGRTRKTRARVKGKSSGAREKARRGARTEKRQKQNPAHESAGASAGNAGEKNNNKSKTPRMRARGQVRGAGSRFAAREKARRRTARKKRGKRGKGQRMNTMATVNIPPSVRISSSPSYLRHTRRMLFMP